MSGQDPKDTTSTEIEMPPPMRVERNILSSARLPFLISAISVMIIFAVYSSQNLLRLGPIFGLRDDDAPIVRFLLPNSLYILLTIIAVFSAYIGYRLTVAAGATRNPVIPPEDYALLSPLVREGKADSIDQYVRLSSLAKFTGSFTQLGLTGLPLATIFLTLFFSIMTMINDVFLDLTKLTLGAFIGSFVQRQVERRADFTGQASRESLPEATTPRASA